MPAKGPKEIALPVLVGVLFYLSFSKYDLWFLLPPALFLLALLRDHLSWFLAGLFSVLPSLLWIRIAMVDYGGVSTPVALTLILLLSLFIALYQFSGTYLLWRFLGFRTVLLPVLWTLFEVLRSHIPYGGFPWLLVGEHTVNIPLLKYYLTAGGVYLGSLILWYLSLSPIVLRERKSLPVLLVAFSHLFPF
ncbi:MAG: hypothetical protein Q9N34_03475 [Aquificota bacterium]|nr:hypothetical protein [Aquificota bacterium]